MKIELDESKCSSIGMCESVAPDLFEVNDDGALILLVPEPPDDRRADVEAACEACPTAALRILG